MRLADITSVYRSSLILDAYSGWLKNDQRVLDIGCGTGVVAYEIGRNFNFDKIVGCDIDEYLRRDIKFKKMPSPSELPFKAARFDIAMLNDVLHHTEYKNQRSLLSQAKRVAGSILIFELIPTNIGKACDFLVNKIHNLKMEIPFTYRTIRDWEELYKSVGLIQERRSIKTPVWYPFEHVAWRLSR